MASLRTIFIIKMMTIWNYIIESSNKFFDKCESLYEYVKDYYCGYHDKWLFIPGHSLPLSLNNLYNTIPALWIYDNFSKSLKLGGTTDVSEKVKCKFAWLSAKIVIHISGDENNSIEYNIDDFIEEFILHTMDDYTPSLYIFFLCWCVYSKHWFKRADIVEFHIIDSCGEEQILTINDHNDSLIIKHNKIYVVIDSEENNTTEDNVIVEPTSDIIANESNLTEESSTKED
jgi:hypothetical protein